MAFKDFYAEFDRLTGICGPWEDQALQKKLIEKLNKRLQDVLTNKPGCGVDLPTMRHLKAVKIDNHATTSPFDVVNVATGSIDPGTRGHSARLTARRT